jgi:divalent metal cation (Fe/Co/Zn/Cd) transporter
VFVAGSTALGGGAAFFSTGVGKILVLAGVGLLLGSLAGFAKIKSQEGESPVQPSPEAMKWLGAAVALAGWAVTLAGLRFADGAGGRIVASLVGSGLSLFGILYILPSIYNKNAFWKLPAGKSKTALTGVSK